jgi:uncharacterized protein (UPF0332 family)
VTAGLEQAGYLLKALRSLEGAEGEFAAGRYDNCASRCYYAVWQAAVHALQQAGFRPLGRLWGHEFVRSEFEGQLIYRRYQYGAELRRILQDNLELRRKADYDVREVTRREVEAALRKARAFVSAVAARDVQ